ncbi:hypothetical protein HD554DRAFT_2133956 [Boletus coccyginus]|nr:hypothetical protein HD554DRAFT_2133956 [Boletus coccyginus]
MPNLLPLPTLGWPSTGATQSDGGADVGENHGVTEDSNDTTRVAPQASFLNPSYILEGIQQNTYLASALRVAGTAQAFVAPKLSPSDFWEMTKKSEKNLQDYVCSLLPAAAMYLKSTKFTDIASAMNHIVSATATFRNNIQGALDAHHITFDVFTVELEGAFMAIMNKLQKVPLPDKAPGHAERAEMVDKVLDDAAQELIKLTARYGIAEEVVTTYLAALKPKVQALTVAVGDINEQHPKLFPTLTFSVAVLLIPESWILGPFLRLFGFGPAGPVKGSAATWMQRRFWGGAIRAGSWFSCLQAAGMGKLPVWAGLVTKTPLLIGGWLATGQNRE